MKNKNMLMALTAFFALCKLAEAQVIGGSSTLLSEIAPKWHLGYTFDAGVEAAIKSDMHKDAQGGASFYATTANLKFQGVYNMRHYLTLSLNYNYDYFDFDETSPLNIMDFSSLHRTSALMYYSFAINEKWGTFALSNISFGADVSESLWGGRGFFGGMGVTYSFKPGLTVGFGGVAYSRVDNDWLGFPIAFLDWRINEHITVRTMAGATVFYDVFADRRLIFSATFEYRNNSYRLNSQTDVMGQSIRRSLTDSYFQFNIGATYNWTKKFYTSLNMGASFDRTLDFRRGGYSAEEVKIDAAPIFMLHLGYLF